jgi:hypothetical protein
VNNQDDFQDDIDPKLQKLYRQLPKEQPSAELDAKILAAAKITTPKLTQNQKKTRHWQAPFALAASVVMVSSVALYMHEENPTAFDASVPTTQTPAAEMAQPAVNNAANVNQLVHDKPIVDQTDSKITSQKAKDTPIAEPKDTQIVSIDDLNANGLNANSLNSKSFKDHNLMALDEKNKSTKSLESTSITKEQTEREEKIESNQLAPAARAPEAYASTPVSTPAPAPQVQIQPEVSQLTSLKAGRLQANHLQDSNPASRQMSAAITESDQPSTLEKSKAAPALSAAPMAAAPMSLGAVASSAMPMQRTERDEATTTTDARTDAKQNMSSPLLSIEGVAIGMNREQLVTQGLTCYVDVCHLDLSQPQQATYWGMPALNGRLTAYLSHHVVTKLVLQQKNVQLNHVKTALSNVGIASHESCKEEKGVLLISRQQGTNIFNVRSMDMGLSLVICQQTK